MTTVTTVASLMSGLTDDPWRQEVGFAPEVAEANAQLFAATDTATREQVLAGWLQKYQPCLFGRIAARYGMLSYCFLTEEDLGKGDRHIQETIQAARTAWTAAAFEGRKSGFVILAIAPRLARARPDETLARLAQRLCTLYLLREPAMDTILYDEIFLEKPSAHRTTWRWLVGANYFSAQGDGRWWHDHRMPGGLGFSMNSVGHLVKSAKLARGLAALDELVGGPAEAIEELLLSKIDSLPKALEMAMRTIHLAAPTVSGRATELLPLPNDPATLPVPRCPVALPPFLQGKNHCAYLGHYHTDHTLPSEYFRPDVARSADVQRHELDFTYLIDDSMDNPDYVLMGQGRRVRSPQGADGEGTELLRALRARPMELAVEEAPRLARALAGRAAQ